MVPGGSDETQISALISFYSSLYETRLNRTVQSGTVTWDSDVEAWQRVFSLPAYPVTSIISVQIDPERAFGADTLLDSSGYYCARDTGLLTIESLMLPGPGVLRVIYVGGMAETTEAFVSAYPDIAGAVDVQIAAHYQRRKALGAMGMTAGSGGQSFIGPVELLPEVRATLQRHRRLPL